MSSSKQAKTWLGTDDKFVRLRKIETLDPQTDFREITELFYTDFQSVMVVQGVAGLLFTYSAPRMSRILSASRQLEHHTAKRYVDTATFNAAVMQNGLNTGDGREAARRVNAMHRQYDIHPQDFVAVGCDVPATSLDLAERFGWRPVTDIEREGVLRHYTLEARAFGSHDPMPDTMDGVRAFWNHYLDTQATFEPQNKALTDALMTFMPTLVPGPLKRIINPILTAQVDPRILRACGLPVPSRLRKGLSTAFVKSLGKSDPKPDSYTSTTLSDLRDKIYPNGWSIQTLGTHLKEHKDPAAHATPAATADAATPVDAHAETAEKGQS
ncbi:oxygenase MpaB family protein [Rhodococcoides yunnanense]|uniref:oxygenase MpaB family protein n=1 Tax=Rhodococcoides yunnanense TaxID=278209 RepID=UPI00093394CE|nr:oxygenase MpaB family protein [Rhodococcus yunnanensis]